MDESDPLLRDDLATESVDSLVDEAGNHGVLLGSWSMIELAMITEENPEVKRSLRMAAGSCACDGIGCEVLAVVDQVLRHPSVS